MAASTARAERAHELRVRKHLVRNYAAFTVEGGLFVGALAFTSQVNVAPKIIESLGGPVWLVALMPAMMQVGFVAPQLFVAHHVERWRRHMPYVLTMGVFQRLPYLAAAGVLLLAAGHKTLAVWVVALCPMVSGLVGGTLMTAWQEMFAKSLPPRRRSGILALRNLISSLIGLGAGVGIAAVLQRWPGTTGYGVLHLVSFGILVFSLAAFAFVRETPYRQMPQAQRLTLGQNLRRMPGVIRGDGRLRAYLLSNMLWAGAYLLLPFMAIHALAALGRAADEAMLGYFVTAAMVGAIAGNLSAGVLGDRFGGKVLMLISRAGFAVLCAWAMIARGAWEFMALFVLQGLVLSFSQVGNLTLGIELCPKDRRVTYLTLMALFGMTSMLVGSQIGGLAWKFLSPAWRFQTVAGMCLAAMLGSMVLLAKVREPRGEPAG